MMSTHRENPKMLRHDVSPDSFLVQVSLEIEPYPSFLLKTGQCAARVSPRNLFFLVIKSLLTIKRQKQYQQYHNTKRTLYKYQRIESYGLRKVCELNG